MNTYAQGCHQWLTGHHDNFDFIFEHFNIEWFGQVRQRQLVAQYWCSGLDENIIDLYRNQLLKYICE